MITKIITAVKPIAELLLKVVSLIDPDKRKEVNKRKALHFAEKYILTNEELRILQAKELLSKKEIAQVKRLEKKLRYLRKYFFLYD